MTNSKYGRILAIATSVCAVLLGILFIVCCAHLYFTGGESPYSRERVGDYLSILAVPSFITIALTVAGLIYSCANGIKDENKAPRTQSELLESFASWFDFDSFDEETKSLVSAERMTRKVLAILMYSISALLFIFVFVYVVFIARFTVENLNADILSAFAIALPISAIAVAIHIPRIYMMEKSAKRELDLLKASIKNHGAPSPATNNEAAKIVNYTQIARYAVLAISLLFILLGIANGGMSDVLQKAVRICTECIGLG